MTTDAENIDKMFKLIHQNMMKVKASKPKPE